MLKVHLIKLWQLNIKVICTTEYKSLYIHHPSPLLVADVIPGLAYCAVAGGILGELSGGTGLLHVQANLLAGLFTGQLTRIFPSYSYNFQACRACQVRVELNYLRISCHHRDCSKIC